MIYGINILVTPKTGDLYEAVAVNTAPIFVQCESEERLLEILKNDMRIRNAVTSLMRNEKVKKTARICYRSFENPDQKGIFPYVF